MFNATTLLFLKSELSFKAITVFASICSTFPNNKSSNCDRLPGEPFKKKKNLIVLKEIF